MTPADLLPYAVAAVAPVLAVEVIRRYRSPAPTAGPDALYVVGPGAWFDTMGNLHKEWPKGLFSGYRAIEDRVRARRMMLGELPRWESVPAGLWKPKDADLHVYTAGPERLDAPADKLIIRRQGFQSRLDTGEDQPVETFAMSLAIDPGHLVLKAAWACAFPLPPIDGTPAPFSEKPGAPWVQQLEVGDPEQSADFVFVWALWMRNTRLGR